MGSASVSITCHLARVDLLVDMPTTTKNTLNAIQMTSGDALASGSANM